MPEARAAAAPAAEPRVQPSRAVIDPELPPDHPLEPGTRPQGRIASPSERIAASEDAISEISAGAREQASTSNFIAAARRAAQAAANAPTAEKAERVTKLADSKGRPPKEASTITSKIRSLLVGASVVVIVLGTFKMAMTLLDGGSTAAGGGGNLQRSAGRGAALPADEHRGQAGRTGATFDDIADADRPAIADCTGAEGKRCRVMPVAPPPEAAAPPPAACRRRRHRRDSGAADAACQQQQALAGADPGGGAAARRDRRAGTAHGGAQGRRVRRL